MGVKSITLASGATGCTVTGGTTKTYTPDGQDVSNGVHVADQSVLDFRSRPHITVKNKNPQRQADGSYSKGVRTLILTIPVLDGANVYFNTWRYSEEYDVHTLSATISDGRLQMAQLLFDADMAAFHQTGSLD